METPLTTSQELLWMGEQLDPGTPLYNMVFAWFLHGEIDSSAFQRAFEQLVQQSDALRLTFSECNGAPCQADNKNHNAQLAMLDFAAASDPRAEFYQWAQTQARQPFDLSRQAYHAALIKLANDEYVWYLNQHHLITDAASCEVLFQRMSQRYLQAVIKQAADTPLQKKQAKATGFLDYVQLEHTQQELPVTQQAIDYWRSQLQPQAPDLAFYGHSGVRKTVQSKRIALSLSAAQSAKLKQLATQPEVRALTEHLSLFNLFAGLLTALLSRVTGESEQQLGVLLHNRATPRLRATAGMLIEVCPLALQVDDRDSLQSLVNKVKAMLQAGMRHIKPGVSRAASGSPFEIILNYLPFRFDSFAGIPISTDWIHPNAADPGHKLRLQVHDFGAAGRYQLLFDLNQAAFDAETSARLLAHFTRLLDACLQDPNLPIGAVDLLSAAERQQHLRDFNDTGVEFPPPKGVLERFEQQARSTPTALAISVADTSQTQLTYAQLDARANQLAWLLLAKGVRRNTIVPLLMQRSADMLVALLAVQKAGAAYLPLEPDHPQERNAAILRELAAAQDPPLGPLLIQSQYATQCRDYPLDSIELDRNWPAEDEKTSVPGIVRNADDLAYVIFTSGSTGKPKGTLIQERGLRNYIDWATHYYLNGKPGNLPLFTSLAFDLTVTSIYLPLTTGGCVHVYNSPEGSGLLELPRILAADAVDLIKLTPSHLALLKDTPFDTARLRGLILGGENLPTEMARWVQQRWQGRVAVYNEYGPTEATVGCMIHRFDPDNDRTPSVPIGRPIANTQVYLLDKNCQPVTTGILGELCIGGEGVSLGYLQREALTRERFVENPFGEGRLYRTGDLGRWREGNSIEFLGRADRQIKLHGARIELDEIATVLQQHPAIKTCAVDLLQKPEPPPEQLCSLCGLSSRYPGSSLDAEGVCNSCRDFDSYREKIDKYFRTRDDLQALFDSARSGKTGADSEKYDCIMLLSGGKDSSYALYQLVGMGLKVLSITLDNGYISASAKANIQRVVDDLGIDHRFETTPHMNAIFADSLARHSNVCNGCFKTIYSLSLKVAHELGVKFIVTGLARGQLFETRLLDMCYAGEFDPERIDQTVLQARKAYHRIDDAATRLLDVKILEDDAVFDTVQFVDFYRYCDVELDTMLTFLHEHAPWIRPQDTGRSTNCLINDVGIYVHQRERGFHNYSLPYSWDVRLGHKTRDEAVEELNDHINVDNVESILQDVGYTPATAVTGHRLTAYYVADSAATREELRAYLAQHLPLFMLPTHYLALESLPVNANGKTDYAALPDPERVQLSYTAPGNAKEIALSGIWAQAFNLSRVGINDNFFELGGDSVLAIQIVAAAQAAGLQIQPRQLFEHPTIAELGKRCTSGLREATESAASKFPLPAINQQDMQQLSAILGALDDEQPANDM